MYYIYDEKVLTLKKHSKIELLTATLRYTDLHFKLYDLLLKSTEFNFKVYWFLL